MDVVVELISSGNPLLAAIGVILSLAGPGYYLYIRQLKKQREFWKEKSQDRLEKIKTLKKDRLNEVEANRQGLKETKQMQKKFIEELKKQRASMQNDQS